MSPTGTLPSAADAATALSSYKAPNSQDLLTQSQTKYGIPELQTRVQQLRGLTGNLTNAIAAVDPSVTGRTAGSFVTEGQRSALVNRERQPLLTDLGKQNQALGTATSELNTNRASASEEARAQQSDSQREYDRLLQTYNISSAREAAVAQAKAQAEAAAREQANADRDYQLRVKDSNTRATAASGGGQDVDPAKAFLDYIGSQFKSAGGAGNSKVTRQQQDAWAEAFFKQNGVSQANRQGYWDIFNRTYNRSADPTKDWRFAK